MIFYLMRAFILVRAQSIIIMNSGVPPYTVNCL